MTFEHDIAPISEVLSAGRRAQEAGHLDEALGIYQGALSEWQPRGGAPTCELLRKIGLIHYYRGDFGVAHNLFESSRRMATELDLLDQIAKSTNCLGIVRQATGELDLAQALYEEAKFLAEAVGDERQAVMVEQNLAILACIRGFTEQAIERYLHVLEQHRLLGNQMGAVRVLNNLGMAYIDLGEWTISEAYFDEALREAELLRDQETLATVQLNRAELYLRLERYDDSRACCDQAFEIFARLESKSGLGETYKAYGVLFRESGKLHLAEAHLSLVAELAQAADHPLLEAEAESQFALVHLAQGRDKEALKSLSRAHRLFANLKARRELVDVEKQLDKLETTYLSVVQSWGDSIESKDRYTAGHCARVADYCSRLAAAVGFTKREINWIRMGAFLHDVGKTAIDAAVLNKTGPLTDHEWEVMRRHTVVGDEIVAELDFPYEIRPIVRSHHERWDGSGYPDRLAGDQIPLSARILAIADAYDALTTTRSYQRPRSSAEALKVLERLSGTQFDPDLLRTFLRIMREPVSTGSQMQAMLD